MKLCVTVLAVVFLGLYFYVSAERAKAQRVDEDARRSADAIIATKGTTPRERAAFFARKPRPAGIPAWLAGLTILAAGWLAVQALFFLRQWR